MHKSVKKIIVVFSHVLPATWLKKLSVRQRRLFWVGVSTVFLIGIPLVVWSFLTVRGAEAAWFDENYLYRQVANITNSNSTALTDFQVSLTVDTATLISAGKMRRDCNDIRITDQGGNLLPFWVEEGSADCNSASTKIWTKAPSIATSGASLFFYYGNQQAASASSGLTTFDFFDDFNKGSIDSSRWGVTGAATIGGGSLNVTTGAVYSTSSVSASMPGSKVESKVKWTNNTGSYSGFVIADASSFLAGNAGSNKLSSITRETANSLDVKSWAATGTTASYNITSGSTQFTSVNDTDYILGQAVSSTNTIFYQNRTQTNTYIGTWTAPFYLWFGYLSGSTASTGNIQDISVDWVLSRKYAATEPTVSFGSEENSPSPVAYWSFDEGTGTVASSSGSTKLNADIYGATWTPESQCVSGKCLFYNGTNNYAVVNGSPIGSAPTGNVAMAAWIKFPTLPGASGTYILQVSEGINPGGGTSNIALLLNTTGKVQFSSRPTAFGSATSVTSKTALAANTWYYISGVIDSGGTMRLYVNGIDDTTTTASVATISGLDRTAIGADYATGGAVTTGPELFFNGFIDEVKIYPFALSAAQVKANFVSRSFAIGGNVLGVSQNSVLSNGLVGYWKMDEASWNGTSGEVIDSSGNSNNGTSVAGANASPSAKFGNAGYFAGTDEYVDAGDMDSIDGVQKLTISSWVNINSLGAQHYDPVVSKSSASALTDRIIMGQGGTSQGNTSSAAVSIGNGSNSYAYTATGLLTTGSWHHWTMVFDGTQADNAGRLKFYYDGVEQSLSYSGTIPATTASTAYSVKIGFEQLTRYFNGNIDETRIYNRAFSPMEVAQLYNFAPGPVGYYNFEEGQGSVVNDSSTYGNNGAWVGGNAAKWVSGKYGKGGNFTGVVNETVAIGSQTNFNFERTNAFTIGAWINTSVANYYSIFSKSPNTSSAPGYFFGLRNDGVLRAQLISTVSPSNYIDVVSSTKVNDGKWHYVSITYDGTSDVSGVVMYIDGVKASTSTLTNTLTGSMTNALSSYIGSRNNVDLFGNGKLDEVRVYNYARIAGQIQADMNAGAPGVTASGKNTIGYWDFDDGFGTVASDSSNLRKNGSIYRATWTNDGKFGKALNFDGNSYVQLGNVTEYKIATRSATFWAKPGSAPAATQGIVSAGSSNWYVGITANAGSKMILSYQNAAGTQKTVYSTSNIDVVNWHHYAYTSTVDSNGQVILKMYIDGKLDKTQTNVDGHSASYGGTFLLGSFITSSNFYRGLLDEVKLYNYVLTAQDVKVDYNRGSSLVLGAAGMNSSGVASNSAGAYYCVPGDTSQSCSPVGEWLMEEGRGNVVNDTSGNNNNGTWNGTGATHWSQGKVGWGGNFNGTSDFVNVPDSTLVSPSVAVTVSAWVNGPLSSEISGAGIAGKDVSGAITNLPYALYVSAPGTILFLITSSDTSIKTITASGLQDNTWHHVVGTYDGSTMKLYVNGVLKASDAKVGDVAVTTGTLKIGQQKAGFNRWFNGKIDQVRVYGYARTAAQVAYEYNQGKPVAYWDFDECEGPTAHEYYNSTGSGTIQIGSSGTQTTVGTCQAVNAAASWYNGRSGKFNYSLNFDGTDDYVTIPSGAFSLNDNFTLSAWIKPTTDANANYNIIGSTAYSTNNSDWYIHRQRSGLGNHLSVLKLNGNQITSTGTLTADSWWHVVFTLTNGSAKLYINGVLDTTSASFGAIATGNKGLVIGRRGDATSYFAGQIDDAQVFNYALTPVQIKTLYNQNSAVRFGPLTGAP